MEIVINWTVENSGFYSCNISNIESFMNIMKQNSDQNLKSSNSFISSKKDDLSAVINEFSIRKDELSNKQLNA